MATRSASQVFTGLTDEPFFISCRRKLRAKNGAQLQRIVSIDEMRLEREVDTDLHLWSTVLDTEDFDLGIIDDGSFEDAMIRGVTGADVALDEYPIANRNSVTAILDGWGFGQSFRLSTRSQIAALSFAVSRHSSSTGSLRVHLHAASGAHGVSAIPTGAALASSALVDIATMAIPTDTPTMVSFELEEVVSAEADTTYCAVIEGVDIGPLGVLGVGVDNAAPTHGGNSVSRSTGAWSAVPAADAIFAVTGRRVPAPSDRYRLIAECTVEYLAAFGGGQTEQAFRRPARVVASAYNPVEG